MALEEALERARGIAYKHLGLGNLCLAQNEDGQARSHFEVVLSSAPEEFGADLLLNALLGMAVVEIRPAGTGKGCYCQHRGSPGGEL